MSLIRTIAKVEAEFERWLRSVTNEVDGTEVFTKEDVIRAYGMGREHQIEIGRAKDEAL